MIGSRNRKGQGMRSMCVCANVRKSVPVYVCMCPSVCTHAIVPTPCAVKPTSLRQHRTRGGVSYFTAASRLAPRVSLAHNPRYQVAF